MQSKTFKESRHTASKKRHEAKRRDRRKELASKRHHEKYREGKRQSVFGNNASGRRQLNILNILTAPSRMRAQARKSASHQRKSSA